MVYEYFEAVDFPLDEKLAEWLYTAILTDTGRFRYRSTSPRTLEIAARLVAAGADPQKICEEVYYNLPPSTMTLTGKVLNTMEFFHGGKVCLLTLPARMFEESGADESESDGLVEFTLVAKGVRVGALLKELGPDSTKVSLRSRNRINVSEIAARFEGGGHANASGCTVPLGLDEAREKIVEVLGEAVCDA
jgi:phosphoesterase RecJ-like protein